MTVDEKGLEADAYLRALLDYSAGFYAAAIEHGMRPGPAADAVQHIERAARNLHRLATAYESARSAEPVAWPVGWAFREGDMVRKKSGSWWEGKIVGWYSTRDTPRGYAIQAQVPRGNGPVQIFPETAIVAHPTPEASDAVALEISHANCNVPGWEYATQEGPRKSPGPQDYPPEGDGWEKNTECGRNGWERFDYTEESYWRRRITEASDV